MNTSTHSASIDAYVTAVTRELDRSKLPLKVRRHAESELRVSLTEASDELGMERALAGFGSPSSYAAGIVAEQADKAEPSGGNRWLGMPSNFDTAGVSSRLQAQMDPQGPWLVPKALGIGWDLNWGRLAAGARLIRPDDIDADMGHSIPVRQWWLAAAAWAVPLAGSAVIWATALRPRAQVPAHWGWGVANRWGSPNEALAGLCLVGGMAVLAGTASLVRRWPVQVRLASVCLATFLADLAAVIVLMTWAGTASRGWWTLPGIGVAGAASLVVAAVLVRSGFTRAARTGAVSEQRD